MASTEGEYRLRKVVQVSSMDIRAIFKYSDGFVAGSRDKLTKVYLPQKKGTGFEEKQCFRGPNHYVSSVTVMVKNDESLVYVGSNDACIYCFDIINSDPRSVLVGHSGTVCALTSQSQTGTLLSGSWDQTAHIWKEDKVEVVLRGHTAAVWAVCLLDDLIFTGSADKTIKRWDREGKCVATLTGHTDCVRGLALLDDTKLLSCSNDATIRQWDMSGNTLCVYQGHENFIYSISIISSSKFVTCSEDKTLRVWGDVGQMIQTIRLPPTTLWSVAVIDEKNIAAGGSDGKVYTLTREEDKRASEEETKELEDEIKQSTKPMVELGDIKVNELPGREALLVPGTKDNQTKLVKEGGKVCVYSWDGVKQEWTKVGDVVGEANTNKDPSAKTTFEGKEYDYVFDVDIEDGAPPLKLPYNVGDNPYMAAQEFIYKHDLSQLYLDQIANFIIKNVGETNLGPVSNDDDYCDPFTGGSRYIPK